MPSRKNSKMFRALVGREDLSVRGQTLTALISGTTEGVVEVTLALDTHQYNLSCPGTFTYISTQAGLDQGFSRLARLVPRVAGDPTRLPRDVVLHRAADMIQARRGHAVSVVDFHPELCQ